ncbi:MAG: hypothetical protein HY226_05640 [Candidatus Vogelbacteria bacterium]|nr:hypothetical protein [Candidatus Vogelbacteria bacterium]
MPKKYLLKFNQANSESVYSFDAIRSGEKWVETRAATPKYISIKVGDILVFECGDKKLERKVLQVAVFKNISILLKKYKVTDIMPNKKTKADLEAAYFSYPDYKEKIEKFGLIAFEI